MWVEREPVEGDTVKVTFSEHTKLGSKIGVFKKFYDGRAEIEFGDCKRFLDRYTTFFVYVK
jgi:hypothetical protein